MNIGDPGHLFDINLNGKEQVTTCFNNLYYNNNLYVEIHQSKFGFMVSIRMEK